MGYVAAIIALLIIIAFIWIRGNKKNKKKLDSFDITDEQRATLKRAPVTIDKRNPHSWNQLALIQNVTKRGGRTVVDAMWYNTMINNDTMNDIAMAQFTVSYNELKDHNINVGDYVSINLDPKNGVTINYTD
ncbi:hypothetical protein [Bifidobacterium magnum]|uniref:Uncharacterized protein n=1 Tax=Bifidobacterium magnum TaxID=1692 RepID=A0A087BDZ3_9BIFI|nr:hypothetical protein [Bifidobacterium magnum]KFI69243.1 hypothetical protein BMAGN_1010 [Bifidobacterium magnum]